MSRRTQSMTRPITGERSEGASLYERDFYAWTQAQATLLEAGRLGSLDLEHLAEEIEDMGSEQRHAVSSQLRHLLTHLLKLGTPRRATLAVDGSSRHRMPGTRSRLAWRPVPVFARNCLVCSTKNGPEPAGRPSCRWMCTGSRPTSPGSARSRWNRHSTTTTGPAEPISPSPAEGRDGGGEARRHRIKGISDAR